MHLHTVHYSTNPSRIVTPADEGDADGRSALRSVVVTGDALDVLAGIPSGLVRTVVTSPPYWSLRDYSTPGQLRLEDDPDEYVASLVRIFDEVRRVLTKDGSLWLNIGDSYTSGGRTWRAPDKKNPIRVMTTRPPTPKGLKPKELVGIPWRLAFALQASGWYLRSDVIWRKPNAMPESVRDRPTRSHEYLFLLTKSERYHYDRTAVPEVNGRNLRTVWDINTQAFPEAHFATFPPGLVDRCIRTTSEPGDIVLDPFLGSGTVAEVAIQNRRAFIGIELNPEYVEIARQRISRLGGGWINGWKKLTDLRFAPIPSDKPIDLYEALISARRLQLQPALGRAVSGVGATTIDEEFRRLVPADALDHVASLGLRGERVFPVPSILEHAPPLIGYYRMLLGISKKDFGDANKLGYGPWKNAEESGVISARILPDLPRFCEAFIKPLADLVFAMDVFDDRDLSDLTLLTLGPTLQGARNNVIGRVASKRVFAAIRTLVSRYATFDSKRLVRFETPAGRSFALVEGTDPDVRLDATVSGGEMPIIAIEIKGGEDASNAHNRAGEAEKSHLKARQQGFDHRWTIMVMRGLDRQRLGEETPSSTRLSEATNVMSQTGADWDSLRRGFLEIIGESS